jgi:recombinational DNA repair ATPase RecF
MTLRPQRVRKALAADTQYMISIGLSSRAELGPLRGDTETMVTNEHKKTISAASRAAKVDDVCAVISRAASAVQIKAAGPSRPIPAVDLVVPNLEAARRKTVGGAIQKKHIDCLVTATSAYIWADHAAAEKPKPKKQATVAAQIGVIHPSPTSLTLSAEPAPGRHDR